LAFKSNNCIFTVFNDYFAERAMGGIMMGKYVSFVTPFLQMMVANKDKLKITPTNTTQPSDFFIGPMRIFVKMYDQL